MDKHDDLIIELRKALMELQLLEPDGFNPGTFLIDSISEYVDDEAIAKILVDLKQYIEKMKNIGLKPY